MKLNVFWPDLATLVLWAGQRESPEAIDVFCNSQ